MTKKIDMEMWNKAKAAAIRAGHVQDAEDIASEYVITKLKGNKTNVHQVIVDYLRTNRGNMRSVKGRAKAESSRVIMDKVALVGRDTWEKLALDEKYLKGLTLEQRIMIKLSIDWDFSRFEIAHLFGSNENAITQRLYVIYKIIRENIDYDEKRENWEQEESKEKEDKKGNWKATKSRIY